MPKTPFLERLGLYHHQNGVNPRFIDLNQALTVTLKPLLIQVNTRSNHPPILAPTDNSQQLKRRA
jgi:hypothetical protein